MDLLTLPQSYFPLDMFNCHFQERMSSPLIVSPCTGKSDVDLTAWAKKNQIKMAEAINKYGAIVFSGFKLTEDSFPETFTAITGTSPKAYKGDTPRDQVSHRAFIYKSTAVADTHNIPPHQEVSVGDRKDMPRYISFFCVVPPKKGTGRTELGNVEKITEEVQKEMPDLWRQLQTKNLTYTARYLPDNDWRTGWIRWLNPSHATLTKRFGTENKKEIEDICLKEGLTCEWDGRWAVISRKEIPGIINVNGKTLLCNQIYLDKQTPQLYGGWLNYILVRVLLYPTSRSMQFDVRFDDGTEISRADAGKLLDIVQKYREGRDWKATDLMIVDNRTTMHAKTPHHGPRKIIVAMGGAALT